MFVQAHPHRAEKMCLFLTFTHPERAATSYSFLFWCQVCVFVFFFHIASILQRWMRSKSLVGSAVPNLCNFAIRKHEPIFHFDKIRRWRFEVYWPRKTLSINYMFTSRLKLSKWSQHWEWSHFLVKYTCWQVHVKSVQNIQTWNTVSLYIGFLKIKIKIIKVVMVIKKRTYPPT